MGSDGAINVQGEVQQTLDVISNDMFVAGNDWGGHLAGMASEEMEQPYQIPGSIRAASYLLVFDPLDGSSNIDVNVSVGSIFSVLRAPPTTTRPRDSGRLPAARRTPGRRRLRDLRPDHDAGADASATATHAFTLDPQLGEFMLTHPRPARAAGHRASSPSTRPTAASGSRR